ncbi:Domain of Uncharacterised Function with PDB structure [Mycobacteroides abscessus subsp. massiliense]|uniref:DUF3850 domain-containing protein n=1 Tax=Mycobacteroides abscessus TaxID=36809 RepID=UPI0009A630E7|nr:DUF3850 domain-containing protein [Mycobacteroides abscessus]SKH53529.1 Domain of Uncharacterised Function with PDB structure [Mycobacteroides abscessus subsp. massiliense]SKH84207.1 Domain of Uncharacterised Function with PDB structure [Mycobacteroides abscessus subsp. massiliense]SKK33651.1 Domain of Uncharacterised Function with PDB structure [Mycobacteroides abscessus subsp. massiliense]SKK45718.1 Domain of Uncharacterised Function with PDB structure [Mycobacteroides abscessus subsp. mas
MTTHHLKIDSHWYRLLWLGEKPYEVRIDDRDYQKGDLIRFKLGDAYQHGHWTVTHVLKHVPGICPGFVVLSLEHPDKTHREREHRERYERVENLRRSNVALRGVITRLRNQISEREQAVNP